METKTKHDREEDKAAVGTAQASPDRDRAAFEIEAINPDSLSRDGDPRHVAENSPGQRQEDDDNPYQNSDEALPDDAEEAAITRNSSREGGRFDEI